MIVFFTATRFQKEMLSILQLDVAKMAGPFLKQDTLNVQGTNKPFVHGQMALSQDLWNSQKSQNSVKLLVTKSINFSLQHSSTAQMTFSSKLLPPYDYPWPPAPQGQLNQPVDRGKMCLKISFWQVTQFAKYLGICKYLQVTAQLNRYCKSFPRRGACKL